MRVRRPSARTSAVAIVVVALFAPCLWAVVSRSPFAVGDIALIELRTRDVFSAHPPLVGAYSRYGWSHPGPLEFYLLSVPYRVLGGNFAALRSATVLFNTATFIAIIWVVRQRGRAATWLLVAGVTALVWGLSPNALADSWNVTIAVLPFLLTIVACWCAWCGDRWAWLVAAIAFTFVFQAHIGFGIVLAPLVVVTIVRLSLQARAGSRTISGRSLAYGAAAVGILASPVIADIVVHWPGNLERLARWSFDNDEPTIGLAQGARLLGRASSLSFPVHSRFPDQFIFSIGTIDVGVLPGALLILLAGALVVAAKRRMQAETWLCTCLLITWLAGLVAAARVTQPLAFWLVEWLQPLAWLTWAAVALVAWRLVQPIAIARLDAGRVRLGGMVVAALLLGVGTVAYARGAAHADRHDSTTAPIRSFVTAASTLDRSQPVRIDYAGDPFSTGTIFLAVADQLDRAGFSLCVDPAFANQFGRARICAGRADLSLLIREEPAAVAPPEGATTLAVSDPLSEADRAQADALTSSLTEVLARNDLSEDEPLLHTPLAALVLDHLPPDEAAASRNDVTRLAELRSVPGTRLGFYAVGR